jgi:hypothetical protein
LPLPIPVPILEQIGMAHGLDYGLVSMVQIDQGALFSHKLVVLAFVNTGFAGFDS